LTQVVKDTVRRGGKIIIPSFAVGRAQEIVYELHRLILKGEIPPLPVYVDSPLATDVSEVFSQHAELYDDETQAFLKHNGAPLDTTQADVMSARGAALRIVFDFGGVLFNWHPLELVRRHFPRHATDAAATKALVASVFQGFGGDWAQFDRGVLEGPELVRRIAARTGLDAQDVNALVDGVPPSLTPKLETVDLLRRLRAAGTSLHFLSNMPLAYAEHLNRCTPT
jgi:hypothetical protein